jgi:AbrB family looped-hinge helix DNA binding protein
VDVKIWGKYKQIDSLSFTSIPDHRGRITIPASVRKQLKIRSESIVSITVKSLKRKREK